jgi:DNA polymerase-3 subunit gamma/tau
MARQSEGSFRDALSLMDQASVLGDGTIDEAIVISLIGSGRQDVQYALADAVAVGDAKGVFELVAHLVQEGQDLRYVTNEVLAHFRDLLIARTAPGKTELLDVTEQEAERLSAQASKYTAAELGRVIALLLEAQTDMRWTTSPRLSLELALVRATVAETDPSPEGLVSRLERLERLAGLAPGGGAAVATAGAHSRAPLPSEDAPASSGARSQAPSAATAPPPEAETPEAAPSPPEAAPAPAEATPAATEEVVVVGEAPPAGSAAEPVLGAGTAAVDVGMLRSNWSAVTSHMRGQGKAVVPSFLESGTPAAYDGQTLEIVFPPDRPFAAKKVTEREGELRQALQEVFGIAPAIRCVVREAVVGPVDPVEDEAPTEEEALARLAAELGATPAPEDGA